ncbi:hypothetical protein JCM11251_005954 [Rhodosporidiobolus azoricus]
MPHSVSSSDGDATPTVERPQPQRVNPFDSAHIILPACTTKKLSFVPPHLLLPTPRPAQPASNSLNISTLVALPPSNVPGLQNKKLDSRLTRRD